ncbi:MAG: GNAT family N-acetyltransferase [Hyphomicrobiales bacterium]|nr:GNAT family N-acetyltransferase [Hyphomicrobiales bacterium]
MTYSHALHEPFRLRTARGTDAASIADLIIISGDSPPDFPKPTHCSDGHIIDMSAVLEARHAQNFAVKHSLLVQIGHRTVGVLLGFRVSKLAASGKLCALPNYLRPTMDVEDLAPASFYVNTLALYPDFQNFGLGRTLLEAAHAKAAAQNCKRLTLEVGAGNPGAIKFYGLHGFKQVALLPADTNAPAPYDRAIVLLQRPVDYSLAADNYSGAMTWRTPHSTWRSSAQGRAAMSRPSGRSN